MGKFLRFLLEKRVMVPFSWKKGEMPVHVNPTKAEVQYLADRHPKGLRFSIRDETLVIWDAELEIHGGIPTQIVLGGPAKINGYFFYNHHEKRFGLLVYRIHASRFLYSKWASFFHQFKPKKFVSMTNARAWNPGMEMF